MKQYNAARTYQFRVQLTRDDHRRLAGHRRLYNGAVLERRDAWRMAHGATVDHLPQPVP